MPLLQWAPRVIFSVLSSCCLAPRAARLRRQSPPRQASGSGGAPRSRGRRRRCPQRSSAASGGAPRRVGGGTHLERPRRAGPVRQRGRGYGGCAAGCPAPSSALRARQHALLPAMDLDRASAPSVLLRRGNVGHHLVLLEGAGGGGCHTRRRVAPRRRPCAPGLAPSCAGATARSGGTRRGGRGWGRPRGGAGRRRELGR